MFFHFTVPVLLCFISFQLTATDLKELSFAIPQVAIKKIIEDKTQSIKKLEQIEFLKYFQHGELFFSPVLSKESPQNKKTFTHLFKIGKIPLIYEKFEIISLPKDAQVTWDKRFYYTDKYQIEETIERTQIQEFFQSEELKKIDFSYSYLKFTNLKKINFTHCKLEGADLSGATLRDSIFNDTNLHNTLFIASDLQNAQFKDAKLSNTDFSSANLIGVDLNPDYIKLNPTKMNHSLHFAYKK